MTKESRIAILGFSLAGALFALMQYTIFSKKGGVALKADKKEASDQDMQVAGSAYQEALMNNEPQSVLMDMNKSFASEYNIQVAQNGAGQIIITDMAGNQMAEYQNQ